KPDPAAWYARPNLGATLATAVRRAGHQAERTESLLHVLTRLSDDQLHRRLPAPVTRLLQDGITPDWAVLLNDLVQRPYHRDKVGLRWRDAFYLATPEPRRT
ncbi:type I-E CRISPR-associated protein Cse2/CasB, partial [Streptomyces sp. RS2]